MKYLDEALYEYSRTDFYPFHMPGHKRNFLPDTMKNFYDIDITEITDFDNLHHAEGYGRNFGSSFSLYEEKREAFNGQKLS